MAAFSTNYCFLYMPSHKITVHSKKLELLFYAHLNLCSLFWWSYYEVNWQDVIKASWYKDIFVEGTELSTLNHLSKWINFHVWLVVMKPITSKEEALKLLLLRWSLSRVHIHKLCKEQSLFAAQKCLDKHQSKHCQLQTYSSKNVKSSTSVIS